LPSRAKLPPPDPVIRRPCDIGDAESRGDERQSLNRGRTRFTNDSVRNFLRRSKDATVAFTARVAVNTQLRGIGKVTELSIDTKSKSVRLRVELAGEQEPIEVHVTRYRLSNDGAEAEVRLTIEEATASREWLTIVLQEFVIGQSFAVPEKAQSLLKLLA
jgi:hypothetical protein